MGWISDVLGGVGVPDTTAADEQGNEPGGDNTGVDAS